MKIKKPYELTQYNKSRYQPNQCKNKDEKECNFFREFSCDLRGITWFTTPRRDPSWCSNSLKYPWVAILQVNLFWDSKLLGITIQDSKNKGNYWDCKNLWSIKNIIFAMCESPSNPKELEKLKIIIENYFID